MHTKVIAMHKNDRSVKNNANTVIGTSHNGLEDLFKKQKKLINKKRENNQFAHIKTRIEKEGKKNSRENTRETLAHKLFTYTINIPSKHKLSNKIISYGEAITYLELSNNNIKFGRVKFAQGRNDFVSLCFEKFSANRYIKLYTHKDIIKEGNHEEILQEFAETLIEKYIK